MTQPPVELPPIPPLPPVSDPEAIGRATDGYLEELLEVELAMIDHLVESHDGHWHLSERDRWQVYLTGPQRDHDRLMAALQQEQQVQQQYQQAVQQAQIAANPPQANGNAAAAPKPPKPGELPPPPLPLLSDRERARHEAYMTGEQDPAIIWLEAIALVAPEEAERTMRDYASLQRRFGG